jgi:hypothetical protein
MGNRFARHTKMEQSMTHATQTPQEVAATDEVSPERELPPAAERALEEAAARRRARDRAAEPSATEIGGRTGPDPVRYGDWETGGIASDF